MSVSTSLCGNNVLINDAISASNSAITYTREFILHAERYRKLGSNEALVLLNRTASLLSTTTQPQYLVPNSLEISKFYINLHGVIKCLNSECDVLWTCIALLQHCARNPEASKAIVNDFHFVPLLTNVFQQTQAQDKITRILLLLQELTFDIIIRWEEPYLIVLVKLLVGIIYKEEEKYGKLALSILVNLCHKNIKVRFLFLRLVDISLFSRKINDYGVLANKMLFILSEVVNIPEVKEVEAFWRATLNAVDGCITTWNVSYLRHIVGFLLDSKPNRLPSAIHKYESFCENIGRYIDIIESKKDVEDLTDNLRMAKEQCISMMLQLMNCVLQLSDNSKADSKKSRICVDTQISKVYQLAVSCIESEVSGIDAVKVLESIFLLNENQSFDMEIDSSLIERLINISEKSETSSYHTIGILQMCLTLLRKNKAENIILSKISLSYFDKLFASLLVAEDEILLSNNSIFSISDIEKCVFGLLWLSKFAEITKEEYLEKLVCFFKMTKFQIAFARVMINGSETACRAVFEISKFKHFPRKHVSKFISQLNKTMTLTRILPLPSSNLNEIARCNQQSPLTKENEEKINALVLLLSEADRNQQLNNIATSQLIELYNYKIDMYTTSEINLTKRLEEASNEITDLSHRICLQRRELEKFSNMNIKLHISKEKLVEQYEELIQQREYHKTNIANLMKTSAQQSNSLKKTEKRLEVMTSDFRVLQKDHATLEGELKFKTNEIERLQSIARDNISRIDKLKKAIIAYEGDTKEKASILEEKERDLAKITKLFEEQKKEKTRCESIIHHMETQLQQKNEKIHNYELELNETEEMRKIILSLMESKRQKR